MPVFPDGRWYTFTCRCGYSGYPLRYTVIGTFTDTAGTLTGGFPVWQMRGYLGLSVPPPEREPELPAWATPEREQVPEAFQCAFEEGELEL
jgi:hypothetical protein